MVKEIELTKGMVALVDDDDAKWLSQINWCLHSGGGRYYASHWTPRDEQKRNVLTGMHRAIVEHYGLNDPAKPYVDHINGDGLDNRKSNLRPCTPAQNVRNRRMPSNCKYEYRGVSRERYSGKWRAQIVLNNKIQYLGMFDSMETAALAYDRKAIEYYGEFSRPNILTAPPPTTLQDMINARLLGVSISLVDAVVIDHTPILTKRQYIVSPRVAVTTQSFVNPAPVRFEEWKPTIITTPLTLPACACGAPVFPGFDQCASCHRAAKVLPVQLPLFGEAA